MKNNFAAKQMAQKHAYLKMGTDFGIQMMSDLFSIALNEPDVMGKDVLGAKRIKKVLEAMQGLNVAFGDAFGVSDDADYYRVKLDQRLKQIFGEDAVPFEVRYPMMKEIKYGR